MIFRAVFITIAMVFSTGMLQAGPWENIKKIFSSRDDRSEPSIKVLIADKIDNAVVEVRGKYNIYDPYSDKRLATRFIAKSSSVKPRSEGIQWGEVFPGTYQIALVPDRHETSIVIDGTRYRGKILIYQIEGSISIVNEIALEEYVDSMMSQAVDDVVPMEALNALAIACRTEACYQIAAAKNSHWHVKAETVNYRGHNMVSSGDAIPQSLKITQRLVLSRTSPYHGKLTPFPTAWRKNGAETQKFDLTRAKNRALRGQNAAQILAQCYPGATIQVMHSMDDVVRRSRG